MKPLLYESEKSGRRRDRSATFRSEKRHIIGKFNEKIVLSVGRTLPWLDRSWFDSNLLGVTLIPRRRKHSNLMKFVTSTIGDEQLGPLVTVRVAVAQNEVNFCTHTYCVINLEIISLLKGPIL